MNSAIIEIFNQLNKYLEDFLELLTHFPEDKGLEYIEYHEDDERQQLVYWWNIWLQEYDGLRQRWEEAIRQRNEEESTGRNIPEALTVPIEEGKTRTTSWKIVREQRLRIDGYSCMLCGATKELAVHHLTYEREGNEAMEDLLTLCSKCHQSSGLHHKRKNGGDGVCR